MVAGITGPWGRRHEPWPGDRKCLCRGMHGEGPGETSRLMPPMVWWPLKRVAGQLSLGQAPGLPGLQLRPALPEPLQTGWRSLPYKHEHRPRARQGQWPGQGAGPEQGTIHPLFLRLPEPVGQEEMKESQPAALTRPAGPAARPGGRQGWAPQRSWWGCPPHHPLAQHSGVSTGGLGAWASTSASPRPRPPPHPTLPVELALCPLLLSPPGPRQALAACLAEGGEGRGPLGCEQRGLLSILRQPSCSLARE